jgi:hypothetical protein
VFIPEGTKKEGFASVESKRAAGANCISVDSKEVDGG